MPDTCACTCPLTAAACASPPDVSTWRTCRDPTNTGQETVQGERLAKVAKAAGVKVIKSHSASAWR